VPAVTAVPPPPEESIHRIPRAPLVDRIEFVLDRCRGRRVLHLGFVDETRMEERVAQGSWLHGQLRDVAAELVGVDLSAEGVAAAAALGFDVHRADCEDAAALARLPVEAADVVLAGELVEHLTAPGRMLDAVRPLLRPGGELLVTTVNAYALTNAVAALLRLELVNSDHVAWYSWWTARTLLERHGYELRELAYYQYPRLQAVPGTPPAHRGRVAAFNAYRAAARPLLRLRPALAEGLVLVARPRAEPRPARP